MHKQKTLLKTLCPDYFIHRCSPFYHKGNSTVVLLIHGFSGASNEMSELGEKLAQKGYSVYGVRLAGHGTDIYDMERTNWRSWYQSAFEGLQQASRWGNRIFICGLSLGGALSLYLTAKHGSEFPIYGVIPLGAPIFIDDVVLPFLPFAMPFRRFVPKTDRDYQDQSLHLTHIDYPSMPSRSIFQLLLFLQKLESILPKITTPFLGIYSLQDKVVPSRNLHYIMNHISSKKKEAVWVENSGHILTEDFEKNRIFRLIASFITQQFAT